MLGERSEEFLIMFENSHTETKGEKPKEIKWIHKGLFSMLFCEMDSLNIWVFPSMSPPLRGPP